MLPETHDFLDTSGYVRDEKVSWSRLVEETRGLLVEKPVDSTDPDEIQKGARTTVELREIILGSSGDPDADRELEQRFGSFLAIGPKGRVQKALENGYVLCRAKVAKVTVAGEPPKQVRAWFVSDDPNVVERFNLEPQLDVSVRRAAVAAEAMKLACRRVPALATRRPVLYRRTQEALALTLPLDES